MKVKRTSNGFPRRAIFRTRRASPPPNALVWSRDLTGHCARATVIGSDRLLVENHTGILEVSDSRVRLNTGCGPMLVTGRDLTLQDARRGAVIIRGALQQVELPCERGNDEP